MPFAVATAGAAALGAGASIYNGIQGANAAKSAAAAQLAATQQADAIEQSQFNTAQADLSPFMTGGTNALAALQKLLNIGPGTSGGPTNPILQMLGIGANGQPTGSGIDPSAFQSSPGYQFQLQQGTNAITNSAAHNGGIGGNALKALQSFGQGTANQGWQQYLSNVSGGYNNLTGTLGGLIGNGQSAASAIAGDAINTGNQIGQNIIGGGNATAAGSIGSANALAGGINGAASSAGNGASMYALLSALQTGGGGAPPGWSLNNGNNATTYSPGYADAGY